MVVYFYPVIFGRQVRQMSISRVFEAEHLLQVHKHNVDITKQLENVAGLGSGTIVVRFRSNAIPSFSPLMNVVNSQYPSSYVMLYTEHAHRVGLIRKKICENGSRTIMLNVYADRPIQLNMLNTLACSIEEGKGYKIFLNGEIVRDYPDPEACFLKDIAALAPLKTALVGNTVESQKLEYDRAVFLGDIDFLHIYDGVLDEKALIAVTGQTHPDTSVYIPPDTYCSEAVKLFYPGFMDAPNYRMPSLLQTRKGTLLAVADQRLHGPHEHPNKINIVMRRSTDYGNSFGPGISVVQMPENARVMDSSMLEDQETGRIFLLTGQFSENSTLFSVSPGSGYESINGKLYRLLLDDNGIKYYADENGEVTCHGKVTPYTVGQNYELFFKGKPAGYIYSERCPLRVYPTSYLVYVYSDDDGLSWSAPHPLNPFVKDEWITFMGCGPGRGIQLAYGPHKGRLLFPVYFVNPHGVQCSALIYSDDHGQSWKRSKSCNDHRLLNGELHHSRTLTDKRLDTNEAQAVELRDGTVLLFAKSPFSDSGCIAIAVSKDGGESFESILYHDPALRSTDSLSVVRAELSIDGCDALIYAGGESKSGSCNGTVKIGLVREDKPQIEWKYSRLVKPGTFGHCSLTMISPDMLGLFYESSGGLDLSFMRMDISFLKSSEKPLHPVEIEDFASKALDGGIMCIVRFNQTVMLCGDKRLKIQLAGHTFSAHYHSRYEDSKTYCFFLPNTPMQPVLSFSCCPGMHIYSVNGMRYAYSAKTKAFVLQPPTEDRSVFPSLFSSHIDTFNDGKRILSRSENWKNLLESDHPEQELPLGMGLRCDSEQMVTRILEYIHINYALPLTLSEMARNLNVNAAYLGRIFSQRVNQSFNSYLAAYRIAKAMELLKNDGLMIHEIAQMVGYYDINHFCKLFRTHCSMSPTEYRKAMKSHL